MLKYEKKYVIKKIREYLDIYEYDTRFQKVNGYYNYYYNPWQKYEMIQANLKSFEKKIVVLFQMLLLGYKYSYENIVGIIEKGFIDALLEVDFFVQDNGKLWSNYSIVSYLGFYFVVSTLPDYPSTNSKEQEVYIGLDTYRLTSLLPKNKINSHLDLCTGSGIQAILEAPFVENCTAVDINCNVAPIAKFNIFLNNVEDKVKIVVSNVYSNLDEHMKYDLITANPPFIPIPSELPFALAGDGGADGLTIIEKVVKGFDSYLNIGGNALIAGEALGNETAPLLYERIKKWLPDKYDCKLILQSRIAKRHYIENIISVYYKLYGNEISKEALVAKWESLFRQYNANSYFVFVLKVNKKNKGKSRFQLIQNYNRWNGEVKPQLSPGITVEINGSPGALVKCENKPLGTIPCAVAECLKKFNGEKTIDEIIKSYKYSTWRYGEIRQALEKVCLLLDQYDGLNIKDE